MISITLRSWLPVLCISLFAPVAYAGQGANESAARVEHRVLATNKTGTMEKEMNEAAEAGFRFRSVMGGESAFGGKEVVAVLSREGSSRGRYAYRLLATARTSTMQKELQEAADAGYEYVGQTVFETAFGGAEVVVILERDNDAAAARVEYRLYATARTSTLEKELQEAGAMGFEVLGLTVGKTAIGGKEIVAIARRGRAAPDRP